MSTSDIYWNDLLLFFARINIFSMLIPISCALIYKKYWNKPIKVIFGYCLITFLFNVGESSFIWACGVYSHIIVPYLKMWNISNTIFLQIFFYWKNFLLLSLFYSIIYPKNNKRVYLYIGILLTVLVTINHMFLEGFREIGVINPTSNAIFIVVLPLIYLWVSQKESLRIPLSKNPYMWISLGLFLPNLIGLFLYISGDYLYKIDFALYSQLHTMKNGFDIIGQILIAIGFMHSYFSRVIHFD